MKYLKPSVVAALFVLCATLSHGSTTANCRDHDFSADIQKYVKIIQDFKDKFDILDAIPTIALTGLEAKGKLCDCCLDGMTLQDAYLEADVSADFSLAGHVPTPIERRFHPRAQVFGYKAFADFDLGLDLAYKAETKLSGTYKKECDGDPCFKISGTFPEGEVEVSGGGEASATLIKGSGKGAGGKVIFHTEGDAEVSETAHLSGSVSYDSCGAGFTGSCQFGDVTGKAILKIELPFDLGNYNLESPEIVLIKGQKSSS